MKKLLRIALVLGALAALGGIAAAATVQGILVDKACSSKFLNKGGYKAAAMHTRECALMPPCVASGYGVITKDNKYITLDAAGNKQAEEALKSSTKKNNIRVSVSGTVEGDTVQVSSLKIL